MITSELTASFACKPDRLYAVITDHEHFEWRSDLKNIETIDPGVRFIEYTKKGFPTFFTVTERKKNRRYAFKMENNNMKGRWTGILEEQDGETRLTLTEEIEHVKTPLMRLLAPIYLKRQQKRYVEDLKAHLFMSK